MKLPCKSVAVTLVVFSVGCVPETAKKASSESVATAAARRGARTPPQMRPCHSDRIFVDVPVSATVKWADLTPFQAVATHLQEEAASNGWFCASNGCPTEQVIVQANGVLKPNASYAPRADGHLRFVRINFIGSETGAAYALNDEGACGAIAETRSEILDLVPAVAAEEIFIGRECDLSAMSLQADPTQDMLAWHTRRLGLPDSVLNVTAPTGISRVDLALIDSGIYGPVASAIGVASTNSFTTSAVDHGHGTALALITRQVAPSAALHDIHALSRGGTTMSGGLTQALDHALFSTANGSRPLVINMSLGAPPELRRSSAISAGSCVSHEDPFGESIRYMLDIANRMDHDNVRPVFVAAAAGNRPVEIEPGLFPPEQYPVPDCSPQSSTANEWFLPGGWHRIDTCKPSVTGARRLSFATAAIDDRNREAVASILSAEPPLVAPGQHVVVAHSMGEPAPNMCTTMPPTGVTLPRTLSGSSVSSALVAAAAARAQAAHIDSGGGGLGRDALARLLYLTGVEVCRTSVTGAPVRRLHVARLDKAVRECPELTECVLAEVATNEPIPSDMLTRCAEELQLCGLEDLDNNGAVVSHCPATLGEATPVPPGPDGTSCVSSGGSVVAISAPACGSSCPDAPTTDRYSIGTLGPQPLDGGCPHCKLGAGLLMGGDVIIDLFADLNPNFDPGVTMDSPWLRLSGEMNGSAQKIYVDLSSAAPSVMYPGENHHIQVVVSAANFDNWAEVKAELFLNVDDGQGPPVTDVSALVLAGP